MGMNHLRKQEWITLDFYHQHGKELDNVKENRVNVWNIYKAKYMKITINTIKKNISYKMFKNSFIYTISFYKIFLSIFNIKRVLKRALGSPVLFCRKTVSVNFIIWNLIHNHYRDVLFAKVRKFDHRYLNFLIFVCIPRKNAVHRRF